jgi:hypothetical protein
MSWNEAPLRRFCSAVNDPDQGDVRRIQRPGASDLHPTMKPLALVDSAIENFCQGRRPRARPLSRLRSHMIAVERTAARATASSLIDTSP